MGGVGRGADTSYLRTRVALPRTENGRLIPISRAVRRLTIKSTRRGVKRERWSDEAPSRSRTAISAARCPCSWGLISRETSAPFSAASGMVEANGLSCDLARSMIRSKLRQTMELSVAIMTSTFSTKGCRPDSNEVADEKLPSTTDTPSCRAIFLISSAWRCEPASRLL